MTTDTMTAYCVKCKSKREMKDPEAVFTSAGTPGTRGTCSVCGTKMFKMGYTPAHEGMEKPKKVARPRKSKKAAVKKSQPKRGKLVIVESPAKARTIGKFLGRGYTVKASVGHIRDLLRSQLSVDVENGFTPKYRVPNEKRPLVKELTKDVARAKEIYLATDADREGEAIAWHLMEATEMDESRVQRVVFHEITKDAIAHAFANPRPVSINRVNAQQTRRILDRLVGYKISPLLWKRVRSRTSAGRVQSVALKLVCDREDEINNFVSEEYWSIETLLAKQDASLSPKAKEFVAKLTHINGKAFKLHNKIETQKVVDALKKLPYVVKDVKRGERKRKAPAPFITSTLQQEASRKLGFGTRKTMRLAQQLYEGVELSSGERVGLITYMRTDSTNIAKQAQLEARAFIKEKYGEGLVPAKLPQHKTRDRKAQDAHEAIRPTQVHREPIAIKNVLSRDQYRLYTLIWSRFVASQMLAAVYETLRVDIKAGEYLLRASGSILKFKGFLSVYEETKDEDKGADESIGVKIPALEKGEKVDMLKVMPNQHFTQPPPRFTEASLVKTLEEFGIGRPSTYATIISTIQDRGYVERAEKRLHPTDLGLVVNGLVTDYFSEIVNVDFTAQLEENLDKIAWGEADWVDMLEKFYKPFEKALQTAEENMPKVEVGDTPTGESCPKCGHDLVIKFGRFGKFIACSNFPDCRYTQPYVEKIGVQCPKCGSDLVARKTKRGRTFYGCSTYPECDWTSWKRPLPTPCPKCGGLLVVQSKNTALCTQCEERFAIDALPKVTEKTPEKV